jgi:four helix bundle protein
MIDSYKQLIVWQKSIKLVELIYKLTERLPKNEEYCLSSQMRRAAISIPSNIAEGYKRKGLGEYLNFLSIADASAAELETQIVITKKLYPRLDFKETELLLEEVQKMLITLIKKLGFKKILNPKPSTLNPNSDGQALVISILIVGFLLSIALTLSALFIPKIRATSETGKSSAALYAAESGLEWCLYVYKHGAVAAPVMGNLATFLNGNINPPAPLTAADCLTPPVKILGTYQGISRALEISF